MFNLGIATEGGLEQADHVRQGIVIERSVAIFASEYDLATDWSGPVINYAGSNDYPKPISFWEFGKRAPRIDYAVGLG